MTRKKNKIEQNRIYKSSVCESLVFTDTSTAGRQVQVEGGGLDNEGDKAMVIGVGKAPSNIILKLLFCMFWLHMRVHSFLPLEDRG